VIVVSILFPLISSFSRAEAQEPFRLRVLSLNMNSGAGVDSRVDYNRIASAIRAAEPDVVALQEVDRGMVRTGSIDQARLLAGRLNLEHAFGGNFEFLGGMFGNAVLSRYPITGQENHSLPSPAGGEPRGALEVTIRPEGGPALRLISTQFDHRRDDRNRLAAADWLASRAESWQEPPTILSGDLNASPGSESVDHLVNDWTTTGNGPLPTVPALVPRLQYDHILVTPADRWRVVSVRVLDEPEASDHRPILAVLEFLPGSP
jgi:endonuclease/exonuclease/phosphatase family metal-dependent hydrolase